MFAVPIVSPVVISVATCGGRSRWNEICADENSEFRFRKLVSRINECVALRYRCWQYLVPSIFQGSESKHRKRRWSWQRSPTSKERRHTAQMNLSLVLQEHQQKTHSGGINAFIIPTRRRQEATVPSKGWVFCVESKKKARQSNRWVCDPDQTSCSPLPRGQNLLARHHTM